MPTTTTAIREDDLLQHIQDTDLFWVWRNGRAYKLTWNQMTPQERIWIKEERSHDFYCRLYGIGMYKNFYI